MSEAPERIWAFAPDIFDNCSLWQDMPSPAGDTIEYIRADYVDALLKAEREKALREAAAVARGIGGLPENTGSPPSDFNNEGYNLAANDAADTILALIENPAG